MEFYHRFLYEPETVECFNSQRDGILPKSILTSFSFSLFQFPTGWNSTYHTKWQYQAFGKVSIPNGMEFYDITGKQNNVIDMFQFPTGWNSTSDFSRIGYVLCCFNSQRDGILLVFLAIDDPEYSFQFPTGWNSTPDDEFA